MERLRRAWTEKDPRTGNWSVRWREVMEDGSIKKKSLLATSYSDAITKRDDMDKELQKSAGMTKQPHAELLPLLEAYIKDRTQVRKLRPGSIVLKRVSLERYVEVTKRIGNINRESLIAYRDDLYSGLGPATVGMRFREVKAFVRWLWTSGVLTQNPFMNIEMPRQEPEPHFLTDDELIRIEKAATPEFQAIFRMAYLTGMRRGELMAARWEDVSWVWVNDPENDGKKIQRAFITIAATTAKNRRMRTIALRQEVVDLLRRQKTGNIFAYDKASLRWQWECAKRLAGITGTMRFHDLRHTFCRLYLQGGGTIADLMAVTGHQSIVMMRVYAHFETRWKAERIDAMNLPASLTGQTTGLSQGTPGTLSVIPSYPRTREETPMVDGKVNSSSVNGEETAVDRPSQKNKKRG